MKIVFDGIVEKVPVDPRYVGSFELYVPGKVILEAIARTHSIERVQSLFRTMKTSY
jgi:hypothetical protein